MIVRGPSCVSYDSRTELTGHKSAEISRLYAYGNGHADGGHQEVAGGGGSQVSLTFALRKQGLFL